MNMTTEADVSDFGEADRSLASASESAVHVHAVSNPVNHRADVEPSLGANRNRNPVQHRVFKTACLYVSFIAMVGNISSMV